VREEDLIAPGLAALRAAFADPSGDLHVVMLSGGLDSRLVLAALVEAGLRDSIVAVTFGIPGTLDFDLAPAVARAAGVRHEPLDLSRIEVSAEALEQAVRTSPWTAALETFHNHLIPARYGTGATYWSGYMGDTIAGIDLVETASWEAACREFAADTRMVRSTVLTPPGFRAALALGYHRCFARYFVFGAAGLLAIRPVGMAAGGKCVKGGRNKRRPPRLEQLAHRNGFARHVESAGHGRGSI
jgi:hypothetical protein